MKKMVCVISCVVILLSCAISVAETTTSFDPTLINTLDYSLQKWMGSSLSRATFSFVVYVDYALSFGDKDLPFTLNPKATRTYTGQDQQALVTMLASVEEKKVLIIGYDSKKKTAVYGLTDMPVDGLSGVERTLSEICSDGWYMNKSTEMQEIAKTFTGMVNNSR